VSGMARQYEARYATEFFNEVMPEVHHQRRVWLGPAPPGEEGQKLGTRSRWADAIVFYPDKILIIEFKMDQDPKSIGQLLLYKNMFKQTIRFQQYWRLPVYMMVVTAKVNDHLFDLAEEQGIEYKVFRPQWINWWEKNKMRL